jgi:IclR family acetate operon transcriptional repressor
MSAAKPIRVLANTSNVIELLAEVGPLSPADIAARTGIPRPSVYRLVDGLNAIEFTETLPDARVALSLRWMHLADDSRAAMREWRNAPRILSELVERTGQTAFLSVLRDDRAVCIDWAPGRGIGVLILKPGRTLPLNAGAAGRVLLAHAPDADRVLAQGGFEKLTPSTLTTVDELRADIDRTREQGYAVSDGDATIGIGALGAPVLDARGTALACISIGGLVEDIRARRDEFLAALTAAARELAP